jgi:hypothetical protein
MKIGNIIELSALHFVFRITRLTLHCFSVFLYNSSNDCKIKKENKSHEQDIICSFLCKDTQSKNRNTWLDNSCKYSLCHTQVLCDKTLFPIPVDTYRAGSNSNLTHPGCCVKRPKHSYTHTVTPAHCVTFTALSDTQIQVARSPWQKNFHGRAIYFCVIGTEFALHHYSGIKNF